MTRRYLIANEPGHPPSVVTVVMDCTMAPLSVIGAVWAVYILVQSSVTDVEFWLLIIPAAVAGIFAGMFASSVISLALVVLGVILVVVTIPFSAFYDRVVRQ